MELPPASKPQHANFPASHLTIAAGVAIFQIATQKVVLCYHTRDKYWFLPKGRRNVGESSARGAEREGFEESGYRNRLLKISMRHRQPDAENEPHVEFSAEPVWTEFLPLSARTQYILFWYIAETIPPVMEEQYRSLVEQQGIVAYRQPPPMPFAQTLRERIAEDKLEDGKIYEPFRHEGTGVDEEEAQYTSSLLPVEEACQKVKGTIMESVIRAGWEGILRRQQIEEQRSGLQGSMAHLDVKDGVQ